MRGRPDGNHHGEHLAESIRNPMGSPKVGAWRPTLLYIEKGMGMPFSIYSKVAHTFTWHALYALLRKTSFQVNRSWENSTRLEPPLQPSSETVTKGANSSAIRAIRKLAPRFQPSSPQLRLLRLRIQAFRNCGFKLSERISHNSSLGGFPSFQNESWLRRARDQ